MINFTIFCLTTVFDLNGFNTSRFKSTIYYAYTFGVSQVQIIYTIICIAMPISVRYIYEKTTDKIKEILILRKNNRIEENKLKKVKEPENLGAVHTHTVS